MRILATIYGVPGTYIKSFLISDKVSLNKWQATHEIMIVVFVFVGIMSGCHLKIR